ncbi:endothelin-converting enzyme homolog [Venturia canescens]|uniref:endothelin-converting enzyme homolog n=1 Tax=Venturia canescens TaxID=32260 RepID=UPI001C9CA9C4|nr:endothelin-converting enzyme homolog [Venturia canescens]
MRVQQILICCTLVAAISFATSSPASLFSGAVFPDDEKWPSPLVKYKFENSKEESNHVKDYELCQTNECRKIAEEFSSSLNKSIDPCEDFYEFSCSGWGNKNPIPPSLPSWSRYMLFQQTVHHRIKEILETEPEPSDILPVRQAKKWYRSCMDTETLEERGMKPIESILLRAGGWPIAMDDEEWDSEVYTWQEVERDYARLTGAYTFFDLRVGPSQDENEYGRIMIVYGDLPLEQQMPLKYRNYEGDDYEEYVNFVAEVAGIFVALSRADVSEEKIRQEAKAMVEFEKQLYEIRDFSKNEEMTMEEFVDWYKNNVTEQNADSKSIIDWQVLIQGLFDPVNIKVHPSTPMLVYGVSYFVGIRDLLAETPVRTIVNFIHWNFVANMLTYTTKDATDVLYALLMEEYGIKERPPRWSECVDEMKMTDAAAYAFVNKYVTKETEAKVLKMTKNIQSAMEDQIEKSGWLDEESKALAKDKLNSMRVFVGFPDWYKNKKAVLQSYKGLSIGTEYFDNTLSFMRYKRKQELKKYTGNEEDDDPWMLDPITVNAAYLPEDNLLNIPAADFQSPLFTPHMPDTVNYATVGVIVGHEIGHGFDDDGIQFGKDGNKTKLSETMLKSFYRRANCFIDQYEVYYEEPKGSGTTESSDSSEEIMKVSRQRSHITRGENMADTTGIQAVFEAYKKVKKANGSVRLPGLEEYTDEQLFFISFGAMWCEAGTPQYEKKRKQSGDPHSPSKIRVIGAVSNTKGFAEAFNCPVGTAMNPVNKCNIWEKSSEETDPKAAWMNKKHHRWGGQWRI